MINGGQCHDKMRGMQGGISMKQYVTGKRVPVYWQWAVLAVITVWLSLWGTLSAAAAYGDNYNINVPGTYQYKKAFQLLEEINKLRPENKDVAMDEALMQSAMQRAAETACLYNNDLRPNYTDSLTINKNADESSTLMGYSTAAKAVAALKKNATYKTAMTNTSYQSVGIGCIVINKYYYWCVLYSEKSSESIASHADTLSRVVTVNVLEGIAALKSGIDGKQDDAISLYANNTCELTPVWIDRVSSKTRKAAFPVDVSSFKFVSSAPAVASVDSKGVVTTHKAGKAEISAVPKVAKGSVKGVTVTVTVKKNKIKASLAETSYVYTGSQIKPTVKVTKGKTVLTLGTDYTVDYGKNVTPGHGTVTVSGKGTYAGQSLQLTFDIVPKTPAISSVTLNKDTGEYVIKWKKVKKISGYEIRFSTNKKMTKVVYTSRVSYKKKTYTAAGLENKTYYVQIRAYKKVSDGRVYSSWSKAFKVKAK